MAFQVVSMALISSAASSCFTLNAGLIQSVYCGAAKEMSTVKIGIMPETEMRDRALAIARGELKPNADDPKIWFPSMQSLAEILSDENRALLRLIQQTQPDSLSALAEVAGRKESDLSRTLEAMACYGWVELTRENKHVRPTVKVSDFQIIVSC